MIFDCHVDVQLRPGISDPQGSTIEKALPALGFDGVAGGRVGKSVVFRRFLTNPVIEDASIRVSASS